MNFTALQLLVCLLTVMELNAAWYIDQAQYIDIVRAHNLANISNKTD